MADDLTAKRLAKRRRYRLWTLPALAAAIGLALAFALGFRPVAALLAAPPGYLLALPSTKPEAFVASHPLLQWLAGWIAAPMIGALVGMLVVGFPPTRWLIDRLFPDPPRFVLTDLDRLRRASMLLVDRAVAPFVGRQAEREELAALLAAASASAPFRWRLLLGPSGIGKSRLALDWLDAASARGWDVGVVDHPDRTLLAGWRPRRPTALVIDEASSLWGADLAAAMRDLGRHATARRPVRLVVLDQVTPERKGDAAERHGLDAAQVTPPLLLHQLPDDHIRAMLADRVAPAQLDRLIAQSAGRPRAAMLFAAVPDARSYADALRRWAELLVPELETDSTTIARGFAIPLVLAALAGPVSTDRARALLGASDRGTIEAGPLRRFFDAASRDDLTRELPALRPDTVAHDLALRLLARLDTPDRDRVAQSLVEHDPERLEATLGAIWRDRPDLLEGDARNGSPAAMLRWVQERFDQAHPAQVAAFNSRLDERVAALGEWSNLTESEQAFELVLATIASRRFDAAVRLREATALPTLIHAFGEAWRWEELERLGARSEELSRDDSLDVHAIARARVSSVPCAMKHYADAKLPDDLERWGERLIALADDPRFADDPAIRLHEAHAAANAIAYYGRNELWHDVERWGARLTALADDPRFADDPAIRLHEATGAFNAISYYGKNQRWDDLERWGARLTTLADDPRFADDPAIRFRESISAVTAISDYGEKQRWDDLERWGARLTALADDPRFADDPAIRLHEAMGAFNAITAYGKNQRWDDLERWGARLTTLADNPHFADDPAIRLEEAKGAVTAISDYGEKQLWEDLERWGARLTALADDPRFAADPAIRLREAMGGVNAINRYGGRQLWEELERWGARLTALGDDPRFAADPAIGLREAKAAVNAIINYGKAGLHGFPRERAWKRRLAFAAQAFPAHAEIQGLAKRYDLAWSSQLRRDFHPHGRRPQSPPARADPPRLTPAPRAPPAATGR